MQQFVIPQFIDVEDKIIGPVTVRQFLIILAGGLLIFIFYRILSIYWFIGASLFVFVVVMILAFVKVNGRPFHYFLINIIETIKRPALRNWSKEIEAGDFKRKKEKDEEEMVAFQPKRMVAGSRLSELSLVVDTGGVYRGEE